MAPKKDMSRPGGLTSQSPTRSFGGPANANTSQTADAQAMGRVVNIQAVGNTSVTPTSPAGSGRVPASQDYGGDGVRMGSRKAKA